MRNTLRFQCYYEGAMYMVSDLAFYKDGSIGINGFVGQSFNPDHQHCSPLMQYTGILGRNGRMVFEGDLRREEVSENTGDVRYYYICTWIKERAMFSWLSLEEHNAYTDKSPQDFDVIFPEDPIPMSTEEKEYIVIMGNVIATPSLLNYERLI